LAQHEEIPRRRCKRRFATRQKRCRATQCRGAEPYLRSHRPERGREFDARYVIGANGDLEVADVVDVESHTQGSDIPLGGSDDEPHVFRPACHMDGVGSERTDSFTNLRFVQVAVQIKIADRLPIGCGCAQDHLPGEFRAFYPPFARYNPEDTGRRKGNARGDCPNAVLNERLK
jgi:hypothetical protein